MLKKRHQKILTEMLSLPTAPFAEDHVRRYVFDFCQRHEVHVREDKVGNILVHYKHPSSKVKRPLCLCAHMDHPGFRAVRMIDDQTLKAQWHGGVMPEYFPRAKVRFHSEGRWIHGRVVRTYLKTRGLERPQKMVETAEIQIVRPRRAVVMPGSPGMWDFPDPQIRGQRIYARACDDIAGAAAMLSALDTLTRTKAKTEAYFLFTRAEEVGFIGAIAACQLRTIPLKCLVVAIETSSVLPGVEMGGGPILRVGDKSTIFNPDLTAWCGRVADALTMNGKGFRYQRKLMDGGSCESTAYCQLGYDATGICIALGNYHNCNRVHGKLAPEYVHLGDVENLIKWFVGLANTKIAFASGNPPLRKRLGQLERRYDRLLKSTA
ncbi:MAG: M20/M25/M40 family metallo-hydrolase [Planctomycetes bacterium]|nr:M20/M25/M40 family metallo-hydrolase [Planctomycetota bacterium]